VTFSATPDAIYIWPSISNSRHTYEGLFTSTEERYSPLSL